MLVRLLKLFPGMPGAAEIRQRLTENLSAEHIAGEMKIFAMTDNLSFERTYGWAWLLQLENELLRWDDPLGRELAANVGTIWGSTGWPPSRCTRLRNNNCFFL